MGNSAVTGLVSMLMSMSLVRSSVRRDSGRAAADVLNRALRI